MVKTGTEKQRKSPHFEPYHIFYSYLCRWLYRRTGNLSRKTTNKTSRYGI